VVPTAVPTVGRLTTPTRVAAPTAPTRRAAPAVPRFAPAPAVAATPVPMVATTNSGGAGGGGGLFSSLFGIGGIANNRGMVSRTAAAPAPQIGTAYYQNCSCGPCGYATPSGVVRTGPPARPWCYFEDQRTASDCPGATQGGAGWWLRTC
jgi:hypothetical protein